MYIVPSGGPPLEQCTWNRIPKSLYYSRHPFSPLPLCSTSMASFILTDEIGLTLGSEEHSGLALRDYFVVERESSSTWEKVEFDVHCSQSWEQCNWVRHWEQCTSNWDSGIIVLRSTPFVFFHLHWIYHHNGRRGNRSHGESDSWFVLNCIFSHFNVHFASYPYILPFCIVRFKQAGQVTILLLA